MLPHLHLSNYFVDTFQLEKTVAAIDESLFEQLLQVIDDLIRMLPAAQRATLKDFPYATAQTATLLRAKHTFLTAISI